MTNNASVGIILISKNTSVFIIHVCLIMFVAIQAMKGIKIPCSMAIPARGPFSLMLPAVNRIILSVMIKLTRLPIRSKAVAHQTIFSKSGLNMVRVRCCQILLLVTRHTILLQAGVIHCLVTICTFRQIMPLLQRKKMMIEAPVPAGCEYRMAIGTLLRKAGCIVRGRCSLHIISLMATVTLSAQRLKS